MTSGKLAAQAISGWPKRSTIAGLDGPSGFPNRPLGSGDDGGGGGGPFEHCAERVVSEAGQVAGRLLGLVRWAIAH